MKINKSSNYDMFVVDEANRSIRKCRKLFKSMKEYGWLLAFPMLCKPDKSGKKTVLDGQHRLEVAKQLKIPVLYVCDEKAGEISIATINDAAMPWRMSDYLSSFCNQGNKDYLELKDFCDRAGIMLSQAVALFSGQMATSNNVGGTFRDGSFKIKNVTLPTIVGDMVTHFKTHIPWSHDSMFVSALGKCCSVKDFKPSVFKQKVDATPSLLRKQVNIDGYLGLIEEIYNYRTHCPIPLKFLCEQEMRKRTFSVNRKAS